MNRILIIDDDADTLLALPALITSRLPDTVVDTAINADAAVASVRTWPYQLILLDIRMPGVDGLTLLRQFRDYVKDTPVIVMTADLNESLEAEALQAGAYAFLSKPTFPDVVMPTVEAALRRRLQ